MKLSNRSYRGQLIHVDMTTFEDKQARTNGPGRAGLTAKINGTELVEEKVC
jgi:hypothetical protein